MTEQKAETLSQELSQVLEEIVTTPEEEVKRAVMVGDTTVMIDDVHYEIVEDYRDGFNLEALNERYNDIFERYDYIVGDWGHEKLRLKGFFKHSHKLATPDRDIDYLQEYLLEYCNFGCQYFVLERDPEAQHKPVVEEEKTQQRPRRERNNETNQKTKKDQSFNLKEFIPKETMKEKEYEGNNFKPKQKKSSQHFSMKEVEKPTSSKVKKSPMKSTQKKGFHIRENQQRGN